MVTKIKFHCWFIFNFFGVAFVNYFFKIKRPCLKGRMGNVEKFSAFRGGGVRGNIMIKN
jgi:hypothetical protein